MLGLIGAKRVAPIVGILVVRRVGDAGKMEGLMPLDAGAAAAAMARTALVAGPRFSKRHAKPRALARDVSLAPAQERCCKINIRKTVERGALHRGIGVYERWPAVGIDEMIPAVHGGRH